MSLRCLLVDDSSTDRQILRNLVNKAGHEVVGDAGDGEEAIAAFSQHRPDVVFMDLVMPKLNGPDASRAILELDPSAKVIAVSGLAQPSVQGEALASGAVGFITKPIDYDDLEFELESLMES